MDSLSNIIPGILKYPLIVFRTDMEGRQIGYLIGERFRYCIVNRIQGQTQ